MQAYHFNGCLDEPFVRADMRRTSAVGFVDWLRIAMERKESRALSVAEPLTAGPTPENDTSQVGVPVVALSPDSSPPPAGLLGGNGRREPWGPSLEESRSVLAVPFVSLLQPTTSPVAPLKRKKQRREAWCPSQPASSPAQQPASNQAQQPSTRFSAGRPAAGFSAGRPAAFSACRPATGYSAGHIQMCERVCVGSLCKRIATALEGISTTCSCETAPSGFTLTGITLTLFPLTPRSSSFLLTPPWSLPLAPASELVMLPWYLITRSLPWSQPT
ncbi:hypothetical protein E1301_Tti010334 [Triplophysa tibetana]|uniref:Uncharacterized protein n=1 Tax=Triplophysa tibetana TaxID=1572043 RepID=A0A5A9PTE9_9TELE|nr:hypothetical protein E1301_Tti010334 [Triplophysa tibetana]